MCLSLFGISLQTFMYCGNDSFSFRFDKIRTYLCFHFSPLSMWKENNFFNIYKRTDVYSLEYGIETKWLWVFVQKFN